MSCHVHVDRECPIAARWTSRERVRVEGAMAGRGRSWAPPIHAANTHRAHDDRMAAMAASSAIGLSGTLLSYHQPPECVVWFTSDRCWLSQWWRPWNLPNPDWTPSSRQRDHESSCADFLNYWRLSTSKMSITKSVTKRSCLHSRYTFHSLRILCWMDIRTPFSFVFFAHPSRLTTTISKYITITCWDYSRVSETWCFWADKKRVSSPYRPSACGYDMSHIYSILHIINYRWKGTKIHSTKGKYSRGMVCLLNVLIIYITENNKGMERLHQVRHNP